MSRPHNVELANFIYFLHGLFLVVLVAGFVIPNSPVWWVVLATILFLAPIMFFWCGGCAIDKYEIYFRGEKPKKSFFKRVFANFGLEMSPFFWKWVFNVIKIMLVVLSLKCYADRIGTSAMERSAIVKIAFVTAIATLAACLTAPTPPRSVHSLQNEVRLNIKTP